MVRISLTRCAALPAAIWSIANPPRAELVRLALLISFALAAGFTTDLSGQNYPDEPRVFHLYEKGIHTWDLRAEGKAGAGFEIRRRDRETAEWSTPVRASLETLAAGATRLPGSLVLLPLFLDAILAQDWDAHRQVTLTVETRDRDVTRTFVRHRTLVESVGDTVVTAYYWAQQSGGLLRDGVTPLDLVMAPGNVLVAAVDASNDVALVRRGFEPFTTQKLWQDRRIPAPEHGYRKLPVAMVRMSDGVRLATDVYLPDGPGAEGPFPVILTRTPYDRKPAINSAWHHIARGYAVVAQDVRGRFDSEGDPWEYVAFNMDDGHETLDWIVEQPWSDGNIGMMGGSYVGKTQWMAAYRGHPALKAIVPVSSVGTAHNDMPYTGGAFTAGSVAWIFGMCGAGRQRDDWKELQAYRPQIDADLVALGRECDTWNFRLENTLYHDGWKKVDWTRHGESIDVPALQLSGWYDDDLPGTLASWKLMADHGRENQKLIMGAWRHGQNRDREINGVELGIDVIRADRSLIIQKWYDRFLRGIENGVDDGPRVEYYSEGDNRWKNASHWPPLESEPVPFYLHSDGDAAALPTSGRLSTEVPASDEPADSYRYDPENPTPSLIDVSRNEQSLPDNYKEVEHRPDVAVYTSAPLGDDLEIAGNISAVLYAASSARDTDWFVRVTDVDPHGNSIRLVEGLIRARFRQSFESEIFLTPGEVERYEIPMRAHAHVFKRGHRIRVDVASAAQGYIMPNSNTGGIEHLLTETVVADQSIHHDAQRPSHVLLPVVRKGR